MKLNVRHRTANTIPIEARRMYITVTGKATVVNSSTGIPSYGTSPSVNMNEGNIEIFIHECINPVVCFKCYT